MWAFVAEAGVALFLLIFIVWWTMYSGQKPMDHEGDAPAAPDHKDGADQPKS